MLLNSERMKKLLGDGNEDLEVTREVLNDKISELNSAIDGVSAQLQVRFLLPTCTFTTISLTAADSPLSSPRPHFFAL